MYKTTRPWSTPLTIASALVVSISGVMMFFHLGDGLVKGAHEWIGFLFVAAMVLHILQHWTGFRRYFSQRKAIVVMSVVLLTSSVFITSAAMNNGEHPARRVVGTVLSLPLEKVAIVNSTTADKIQAQLATAGIIADSQSTLGELARQHNRHPFELLELVLDSNP